MPQPNTTTSRYEPKVESTHIEKIAAAVGKYTSPAPRRLFITIRLVHLPASRITFIIIRFPPIAMTSGLSVNIPISWFLNTTPSVHIIAVSP